MDKFNSEKMKVPDTSKKIDCQLHLHSNIAHLQQAFTGFMMLERQKVIKLKQKFIQPALEDKKSPLHLKDYSKALFSVILNKKIVLCYDLHDSSCISENNLNNSDFYFKRSFGDIYRDGLFWQITKRFCK